MARGRSPVARGRGARPDRGGHGTARPPAGARDRRRTHGPPRGPRRVDGRARTSSWRTASQDRAEALAFDAGGSVTAFGPHAPLPEVDAIVLAIAGAVAALDIRPGRSARREHPGRRPVLAACPRPGPAGAARLALHVGGRHRPRPTGRGGIAHGASVRAGHGGDRGRVRDAGSGRAPRCRRSGPSARWRRSGGPRSWTACSGACPSPITSGSSWSR